MKSQDRFLVETGREIYTGNELLIKGALETEGGVHLLAGYPGSPVAGYFDALPSLKDLLNEKGIYAAINNNEALSAAMLNGLETLPARGMIVLKSVGVHVAADGLALANLAGAHPKGGAIVVYGDDPWSDSTQVPSDTRYLSKHLYIPVIEPSTAQEVKDYINLSFKLSARSELYVGFVLTNNLADGGGTVECKPNHYPEMNLKNRIDLVTRSIPLKKRVLLPPKTWWQEESFADRFSRAQQAAREMGINRIEHPVPAGEKKPIGFVAAGLGHSYLTQALSELGVLGDFPILKFGLSYPIDPTFVEELSAQCERIIVIEERRGFMEEQIADILATHREDASPLAEAKLFGKVFPGGLTGIPDTRGLDPSILMLLLGPLLKYIEGKTAALSPVDVDAQLDAMRATERVEITGQRIPLRLATFCPGCPHRDTASLCLDIQRKLQNPHYVKSKLGLDKTIDLLFHGDTGCYTMLMFPPNTTLMHDYSGMGLGGGTGSGTDKFVTNKEVVFMGDSTFYHSGQIAIAQAISLQQDLTFIILDNSTTAMTGHQPQPGNDYDVLGNKSPALRIEDIVRGIAGGLHVPISRVDPERRQEYRELLEETFLKDGVKIIIADKECGITSNRRRRRQERAIIHEKGFLATREHMNVNADICRYCLACTELAGCPGMRHVDTDYGPKIDTDLSWCVNDGACERVGACNAFERVTIHRKQKPQWKVPDLKIDHLPEPKKRTRESDELWQCVLTGVGGMGIGLVTSILVRAGHKEGYIVDFLDKKGLAIRNGGVVSQVVFHRGERPVTALIPYGQANLLLGVDVLEAARTLDPAGRGRMASKERTAAVINTDKIATVSGLMGREDYDPEKLVEFIRQHTREEDFLARNVSRLCEKYLGSKIYANIMMLGYAFQQGLIPVSMHSIAWAIKDTIRVEFRKNLYAFNLGRKLVEEPGIFQGPNPKRTWQETLEEKVRWVIRRYGKVSKLPDALRELTVDAVAKLGKLSDDDLRDVVIRLYDCLRWGGLEYAKRYADQVVAVCEKDHVEYDLAATRAVIRNLADAMLIKDAFFEAELATAPEKFARDREKYNVNPHNGDRISYRYLWKRHITLHGRKFRVNLPLQTYHMHVLKHSRWLRPILKKLGVNTFPYKHLARYEAAVTRFSFASADEYRRAVATLQSPTCHNCTVPTCSDVGCPLQNEIPTWTRLVEEGKWKQACASLHEKNNFPEFTAAICPAFCQDACKRGQDAYPVQVRDLEGKIVERGFANGYITPQPASQQTGQSVAVIGSGPAGLAAAQQLARAGHAVTVFEKDDQPGGLLRYGIPGFRLDKDIVDRRLRQLRDEGVTFRCDTTVGVDVSSAELQQEFDAVCLALGAGKARELNLSGRHRPGVLLAMDFLRSQNRIEAGLADGDSPVAGQRVVVIGGGLTGEDCVEAALKQGAASVTQLEILPKSRAATLESPGEHADKLTRHWGVSAQAFLGGGGDDETSPLTQVAVRKVLYTPSAAGPVMGDVADSEFTVDADFAILAAGFLPEVPAAIAGPMGLDLDEQGRPRVDELNQTDVPNIFAAGDLVTGAGYVVTAIDSARRAATQIDDYLRIARQA